MNRKIGPKLDIISCIAGEWTECGFSAIRFVYSALSWQDGGKVYILGRECKIKLKGRFRGIHFVWDGRTKCPFGQEGKTKGWKNPRTAAQKSVQEFFKNNQMIIESMS